MKYYLLIKNYLKVGIHNDWSLCTLIHFLSSDVGDWVDNYEDFFSSDLTITGGNSCQLEKENGMILFRYYYDKSEKVYLRISIDQLRKVLVQWGILWKKDPNFILVTKDDHDEINLQGFNTQQDVKNKMESMGLEFPYIDPSLMRKG